MSDNALMTTQERLPLQRETTYSGDQVDLIKRTVAVGSSDDELKLFMALCKRTGLDPFNRQIYAIKRSDKMTFQVSIDGLRLLAERTGQYRGQSSEQWCDANGKWLDVWASSAPPVAARVFIYREGWQPIEGKALWAEYAQSNAMWRKYPATMLAKCAEAKGLRKAFPYETSGLYASDEIESVGDVPEAMPYPTNNKPMPIANNKPQIATNGFAVAHNPNEDDYEYRERNRLLGELFAYMKQKAIQPNTVKSVAQDLGITNDAYHMTSAEITRLYIEIKKSFDFLEKNQQEPVAPFTPPEESKPPVEDPTVVILNDQTISALPPQPEQQPADSEKKNE